MKTTVITGAGSGIGQAIAFQQGAEGNEVIILDYSQEAGDETANKIIAEGGTAKVIQCDVSDTESVKSAFEQIEKVDILINNAGIASIGNVEVCTADELDRIYQVNVKGVYHCLHYAIPKMLKNEGEEKGSIVNLASIASKIGIQDRFAYSMSKGAAHSITLSIARDYVEKGIRCNCVCPARVHTPFVDGYLEKNFPADEREAMFKELSAYQPMKRMGTPAEIADLVGFLASDKASFITGSAYDIDGGVTLLR